MVKGTVIWFNVNRGYGFLAPDEGHEAVFVHYSAIVRAQGGYRPLQPGQRVMYEVATGPKGPQAANLRPL